METVSGFLIGAGIAFFAIYLAEPVGHWLARLFGTMATELRRRDLTLEVDNLRRAVKMLEQRLERANADIDKYQEAEYERELARWKQFMSIPAEQTYHTPVNVDLYAKLKSLWKDNRELIVWPFPMLAICRCRFEVKMDTHPVMRLQLLRHNLVLEHNGREGDVKTYHSPCESCPSCTAAGGGV